MRNVAGVLLAVCLGAGAAKADDAALIAAAAGDYQSGRVLKAEIALAGALSTGTPQDRWAAARLLIDVCTYGQDFACIDRHYPAMASAEAADASADGAKRMVFVTAFHEYLRGNLDFFRKTSGWGLDFAARVADPASDPALAARLFLLDAGVEQQAGDFATARLYLGHAFDAFLRIDAKKDGFESAAILKLLIQAALAGHDSARAARWLMRGGGYIAARLPDKGFDHADFLTLETAMLETGSPDSDDALKISGEAVAAFGTLEIAPAVKDAYLSDLRINRAALYALSGDKAKMKAEIAASPIAARRDAILARGAFADAAELSYAAAEIFFTRLAGQAPDPHWKTLLEQRPHFVPGADLAAMIETYRAAALALLEPDRGKAEALMEQAAKARLADFERGREDGAAFPLPTLLDRIVLTLTIATLPEAPDRDEADLLVKSAELLDRNPRYALSDALARLAAQDSEATRDAAHAQLRLEDRRGDWEDEQIQHLVAGEAVALAPPEAAASPVPARPASPRLPSFEDVQGALKSDEAVLAYAAGRRICIAKSGVLAVPLAFDAPSLRLDVKLLSDALSADNPPSDNEDSQYPVAASIRLYHALLDGLDGCLKGVRQLIYFAPADAAAIPLGALLTEAPEKSGAGYDLSHAHWLIRDYAVSEVTSIRDFLAARSLLARKAGDRIFLGFGDPDLRGGKFADLPALPETAAELKAIAQGFGPGADIRVGAEATEADFRALPLSRYRVLHFATHGLVRDDLPGLTQAALVLTPGSRGAADPSNDGLLTAGEIADLNLSARLAVLSACNTANFDEQAFTSQVQGLASSFAVAGVPSTVASLWPVNSEISQRLMVAFYQALRQGQDAAQALRAAMLTVLNAPGRVAFAHPRFWAPFLLLGDGGAHL